jgi:hypothetical protein
LTVIHPLSVSYDLFLALFADHVDHHRALFSDNNAMQNQVSIANPSSSGTHRPSTQSNGEVHRFNYVDWIADHMSETESANFKPGNLAESVDRYFRQSINSTAPDFVPSKRGDVEGGWRGHLAKERVSGNGTISSITPNVYVKTLLATRVDYTTENGAKKAHERLDIPRLRFVFGPTYDDENDPTYSGEQQVRTDIDGGESEFVDDDLMAFEKGQQEIVLKEDNAVESKSNDDPALVKQRIGTAVDGQESKFVNDDLMAFEQGKQESRLSKNTIAVGMELNDNLRPTKGTWLRSAQSWRPRYPGYPSANPTLIIQEIPESQIESMASIPLEFTATPDAPTWPLPGFPPVEDAYKSIADCRPELRS